VKLTQEIKRAGVIARAFRDYERIQEFPPAKQQNIREHAELAARGLLEWQGVAEPSKAQVESVLLYSDN